MVPRACWSIGWRPRRRARLRSMRAWFCAGGSWQRSHVGVDVGQMRSRPATTSVEGRGLRTGRPRRLDACHGASASDQAMTAWAAGDTRRPTLRRPCGRSGWRSSLGRDDTALLVGVLADGRAVGLEAQAGQVGRSAGDRGADLRGGVEAGREVAGGAGMPRHVRLLRLALGQRDWGRRRSRRSGAASRGPGWRNLSRCRDTWPARLPSRPAGRPGPEDLGGGGLTPRRPACRGRR